ncbi:hypothetical protein Pcaca01_41890 [Pectobacterium carotovorum subsp. carotovorum]|nr:hypothetical protein Pcaca01_41890 [Pectobacterium carotovorum subsp. carotovorum]
MNMKFNCTGLWNGEKFNCVIESRDEDECRNYWQLWMITSGAKLEELDISPLSEPINN